MLHVPDEEILSIAGNDRHSAFELAFHQYWERLFWQAVKKVQSEDIAKDLVQETFISFWDNIGKLPAQTPLLAYLYGILRNKVLQHYEKNEVRLRYAMSVAAAPENTEPSSHHLLLGKELQTIVKDEINKMPARMREIYLLQKESQLSIKEIAEQLKLSEQTIKNQLHMAATRLKDRIKGYDASFLVLMAVVLYDLI
jgi:RNA polymerase sigma-70 factor, ECF subfamily